MENYDEILEQLSKYRHKHGLYIIRPNDIQVLKDICLHLNYDFKSEVAYIGKGAKTKSSDLGTRGKQEMGWSNFEGATFVKKIGLYLGFDVKNKTNKILQENTREFICSNFTIEFIEFNFDTNLIEKETEYIELFMPCLNVKKNHITTTPLGAVSLTTSTRSSISD